jgi:nicotinate phosphoribosyltransferase
MDSVSLPYGSVLTGNGEKTYTVYTSCADMESVTYYFTTYGCRRIRALNLFEKGVALSNACNKMLDEAGYPDCNITASNSLDEHIINDMLLQGAKVDCFVVGERLINSASSPIFSGVYKLSAVEKNGEIIPKINLSENVSKITTPHSKMLYRLFDCDTGKAIADVLTLDNEEINDKAPYTLFDPDFTWKRKEVENFVARKMLVPVFVNGECVYKEPALEYIRDYCAEQIDNLWEEVKRFENPHTYYVDLSEELWRIRKNLIEEYKGVKR